MTRVCLLGDDDVDLPGELLGYETAREALASYAIERPFLNSIEVETVSLGAAVSFLNDLDWYLVRLVSDAFVLDVSISETEWLSRALATAIRREKIEPEETGEFLKVYGVVYPDAGGGDGAANERDEPGSKADSDPEGDGEDTQADNQDPEMDGPSTPGSPPRLTDPMYARRVGGVIPEYDLVPADDVVVVRVTPEEFGRG